MADMAHGHARPFKGHLVWPWKGQRAPRIVDQRCLSAPHGQNQKIVTGSACADSQAPDSAGRVGLLALAEAKARPEEHTLKRIGNHGSLGGEQYSLGHTGLGIPNVRAHKPGQNTKVAPRALPRMKLYVSPSTRVFTNLIFVVE